MSDLNILLCPECGERAQLTREAKELWKRMAACQRPPDRMVQLCPECGELLIYDSQANRMRKISDEEIEALPLGFIAQLGQQQDAIRARHRALFVQVN